MKGKPLFETPGEEILITLNTLYPVLKRLFGIRSIGVFGRIAHGEDPPDDVIELLVEFTPAMECYGAYAGLFEYLEEKFSRQVRLVTPRMLEVQPVLPLIPDQPLPADETALLRIILDVCIEIREQCREMSSSRFSRNEQVKQSVAQGLDRAGLAAAALPDEFRRRYPGVECMALVPLRSHLIQNPYGVDGVFLWSVVQEIIPPLEHSVQAIVNAA